MKTVTIIKNGKEFIKNGRIVDINNNWGKCFIVEDLNSKNNVIGSLWKHNRYEFACGNIKKIEGNKIYIEENY